MRTNVLAVALGCALTALAAPLAAQDQARDTTAGGLGRPGDAHDGPSLLLVNRDTRVRFVGFRFLTGSDLSESRLRDVVALDGPGALVGLREKLSWVPGISDPELERFDPLTLQMDLARLRRLYRQAGFPQVRLDYDVALDTAKNVVAITHVIDQGSPLTLDSVVVHVRDSANAVGSARLPSDLAPVWTDELVRLGSLDGRRYGEQERSRLRSDLVDWFRRRGYPWVVVELSSADTIGSSVVPTVNVNTGPRTRVAGLRFEGRQRLSEHTLRREIAIRPGDWYDAQRVTDGERELYELDLVNRALGDVLPDQESDTTVSIRFRVEETEPRLVWGRVGWRSEAGVSGEAHWSHRDFMGGARTLTLSTTAETGWAALSQTSNRSVGVSALIRQPYLWHRRIAGTVGPFVRYRDDFRDRSLLYGVETAVIYRWVPLETLTLQHELSRLRVDDALQLLPIREIVENGDSTFGPTYFKSIFKASATYGRVDNRLDPHSGFVLQPSLQFSAPTGFSDVEYVRMAMEAIGVVPLSDRFGVFLRGSAGRLFPFGESAPPRDASRIRAEIGLRGAMFTAGGASDLRAWGRGLVGPKVPDVTVSPEGVVGADGYVPVGGLARLSGSFELMMPFPFLARPHGTFAFLDAGRVWTPGSGFRPADPELAVEPWAYGVGAGMQFGTPVGPIRLAVGYKLDPTRVDLLDPVDVARTLASGGSLSALSPDNLLRWHLHLSIGRGL